MIPCQCCGKQLPATWNWWACNRCGFRVCPHCLGSHRGQYGTGFKCSQCPHGHMEQKK
jgi:hypothetical protein